MAGLFFKAGVMVFLQGFWENVAADRGFLMVKSWWIAGERWSENGLRSGARNMPLFFGIIFEAAGLRDALRAEFAGSEGERDGSWRTRRGLGASYGAGTTQGGWDHAGERDSKGGETGY
jgi:hypothetical protein